MIKVFERVKELLTIVGRLEGDRNLKSVRIFRNFRMCIFHVKMGKLRSMFFKKAVGG